MRRLLPPTVLALAALLLASPHRGDVASLAGRRLWRDPDTAAARVARAWRTSRPRDAAILARIAAQPQAVWLGAWSGDVAAAAARVVARARAARAVPVLVVYRIPGRGCASAAAGEARAYRAWIRSLASGIGDAPAGVVLEPDALAQLDCLGAAAARERIDLLRDAVGALHAHRGVALYVDAGHSHWQPAAVMADRLRRAGVAGARGFALDVSNFRGDRELAGYAHDLARRLGGEAHAVLDTSRNGAGPAPHGAWCNPRGRALGAVPTTATGDPVIDAKLWIKRPGESDGTCGGGPAAGTFWPRQALALARAAGW